MAKAKRALPAWTSRTPDKTVVNPPASTPRGVFNPQNRAKVSQGGTTKWGGRTKEEAMMDVLGKTKKK